MDMILKSGGKFKSQRGLKGSITVFKANFDPAIKSLSLSALGYLYVEGDTVGLAFDIRDCEPMDFADRFSIITSLTKQEVIDRLRDGERRISL